MKIKLKSLSTFLIAAVIIVGCKKEGGNPLADIANLSVGAYPTLTSVVNLSFNNSSLASSKVAIKVTEYKTGKENSSIQNIKIYVVKGASADKAAWKLVKTVPYSDGVELSCTGSELAAALGVPIGNFTPGDYYTFYNQVITKDGRSFDIVNTPLALGSLSAYNAAFTWVAYITCPFTGGMAGNYTVVRDDWADWSPGDIVQVADGPGPNQIDLSQVWPNPAYGDLVKPLIVNVDPTTGAAKVPLVTFGNNYPGTATAQGADAFGASDTTPCGYVFSCTKYIALTMKVTYNGSSQGNMVLILKQ